MTKQEIKAAGERIANLIIKHGGKLEKDGETVTFPDADSKLLFELEL